VTAIPIGIAVLAVGMAAAFLALLLRAEAQLTDVYAERKALRQQLADAREDAAYERNRVVEVTKERNELRAEAYLHETWTIGGGGESWAA
jgi:uncharacterized protein (DUF3084 family)